MWLCRDSEQEGSVFQHAAGGVKHSPEYLQLCLSIHISVFYTEVTYLKILPKKDCATQYNDIPAQTGKHLKIKNVSLSVGEWLCNPFICSYRRVRLGCMHFCRWQLVGRWSHRYFDALSSPRTPHKSIWVKWEKSARCIIIGKSVRKSTNESFITMEAV